MDLRARVTADLKQALKNGESVRVSTLRLLQAQWVNEELASTAPLAEDVLLRILQREVKKRREAADAYRQGSREDMANKEDAERAVLEVYLPAQLSDADIEAVIRTAIDASGASGTADQGKIIGAVMGKVRGQADGARVRALVERLLSSSRNG